MLGTWTRNKFIKWFPVKKNEAKKGCWEKSKCFGSWGTGDGKVLAEGLRRSYRNERVSER